jgi:hypothetical protein
METNKRCYTGSNPLFNNIPPVYDDESAFSKSIIRIFEAKNQDIPDCESLHNSIFSAL